jgi:hydrogenase nickel incorporation protein HypB
MCATCGCGSDDHPHPHDHHHPHGHAHHGMVRAPRILRLERDILSDNQRAAVENREWLDARGVLAFNLMGSPGAGKTTLLEQTIRRLGPERVSVIEGDQETRRDADRIARTGSRVAQINTGTGCHLDARTVSRVLEPLGLPRRSLLAVENVGNLVCPALFDLGERVKVVLLSVAEGDDKPEKYPHMFRSADVLVLGKIDLAPHVDFDRERCTQSARRLNPSLRIFPLSTKTGEGLDAWCRFLDEALATSAPSSRIG